MKPSDNVTTLFTSAPKGHDPLVTDSRPPHDDGMSAITRDEINARLEASEARTATITEAMRSEASALRGDMRTEMVELRADLREGMSAIRVDIEKVRGDSHKASLDITRWIMATVVTIGLGFVGVILTGAGIYLRYLSTL